MDRRDQLREGLERVTGRMASACRKVGRAPTDVRLIAVSKRMPVSDLRLAYELGQRDFGENYVQELLQKREALAELVDVRWHLIGHLQRNKARHVAALAPCVHTIDDGALARELDKRARTAERRVEVFIEVNLAGESQKAGCSPAALPALVDEVAACSELELVGLMAIPPASDDAEASRPHFAELRRLASAQVVPLPRLSMGMSADFEIAIEEGATDVRVGTLIFGSRMQTEGALP